MDFPSRANMTHFETLYKYILQLASDGLIVYSKDGTILDFNDGACVHLGYSREEFARLRIQDLILEEDLIRKPLDLRDLENGKQVTDRRKIKTRDKGIYIVEVSTLMLPDGNFIALAKDITEKSRIEKDLKLKEHAIATSVFGVGIADLNGRITYANEALALMWGYPNPKEMEGKFVQHMFESSAVDQTMHQLITNGLKYHEAVAKRADGSLFDVALSGSAIKNKMGEPIYMFGSFIDVSSRKIAESQLTTRYKELQLLNKLTEAVSHANQLEEIYNITIDGLIHAVHADRVSILIYDNNGLLEFRASRGLSENYKKQTSGHCPWRRDETNPSPILVPDATLDASLFDLRPVILGEGIRALGFIPLIYSGRLLGKFMVYFNEVHHFSEQEIQLLQTISREVAFALGEKKIELALRKSEQQYRAVVDNTREVIFQADTNGNWTFLNPAWTEILGFSREESLGRACHSFVYPEDEGKMDLFCNEVFTRTDKQHQLELRMLNRDGKICWMEFNARALKDDEGKLTGVSGIIRDITASKEAVEQIIREKELSDSVINTLPGIFYIYDNKGTFYRWNRNLEQVTGYSGEEIVHMKPLEFFDEPEQDYMAERIKAAFVNGAASAESFLFTKGREKISYYFNCITINYEGENCTMGMGIDMTERKKVEKQLQESTMQLRELSAHLQDVREEERTAIAREIHDELGQQLTVLRFDISWLQSKLQLEDEILSKKLESIQSLLEKAMTTIRRLSSELRPSLLDDLGLSDTIEWYLQDYKQRFGIQTYFHNSMDDDLVHDKAKTALFRIFQESLTNVIRHAGATKVRVKLSVAEGQVVLRIEDNGVGFRMEEVAGKKTLGLIGMKERSLLLGGKCQIESSPGNGTVVTVSASLTPQFSGLF